MRRFQTIDTPPAGSLLVEHGAVRFHLFEKADGTPMAMAFRGKSERAFAHYRFLSVEKRERWIEAERLREDQRVANVARRNADRKARAAAMADRIQVGTILHYSWGYEQTNCEFFLVTARSGMTVTLQPIGSRIVEGSEGFMCDSRRPDPTRFLDEPTLRKRIGAWGVSMPHGACSPCGVDDKFSCTWYA